jgi:hypothetical protein
MPTKAEREQKVALYRELFDVIAEIIDDDEITASEQLDWISEVVMPEQFDRDDDSEES